MLNELVAVKEGILPVPDEESPVVVLSLVQVNIVVPSVFVVVNSIASVDSPLHNTWSTTASTCAVGFTAVSYTHLTLPTNGKV